MKQAKRFGKSAVFGLVMAGLLLLSACGTKTIPEKKGGAPYPTASSETAGSASTKESEEEALETIEILVGNATFTAKLADTEAARQLAEYLPVELNMQELNGNEKYSYLSEPLPASASRPDCIRAGDLMLFGSDCLVLFYKDFSTSYSYTPIGKLETSQGLPEILGPGDVTVTIRKSS